MNVPDSKGIRMVGSWRPQALFFPEDVSRMPTSPIHMNPPRACPIHIGCRKRYTIWVSNTYWTNTNSKWFTFKIFCGSTNIDTSIQARPTCTLHVKWFVPRADACQVDIAMQHFTIITREICIAASMSPRISQHETLDWVEFWLIWLTVALSLTPQGSSRGRMITTPRTKQNLNAR